MKVSFNQTTSPNVRDTNGYGYAAKMCKDSLERLGHEISWRDSSADIEINFIQPENWHWTGPYRIAYLPWESDQFREGWVDSLNECDEVWTPSPVVKGWMQDAGVKKDIVVYEHGVEPVWEKRWRNSDGKFELFHQGAEALRKGGNETIQAFLETFTNQGLDARLKMKMVLQAFNIHDSYNMRIRRDKIPIEDLVALYHECHLCVYPSWGEGFGLVPLQAMATGMPVLITKGWAPYENYLGEENLISSTLTPAPWQDHHPGRMFEPDLGELREKMLWHFENRQEQVDKAHALADIIHRDYQWDDLTRKAFAHLV